jgi:hypothetical protein
MPKYKITDEEGKTKGYIETETNTSSSDDDSTPAGCWDALKTLGAFFLLAIFATMAAAILADIVNPQSEGKWANGAFFVTIVLGVISAIFTLFRKPS